MNYTAFFSPDYTTARVRFLAAADRLGGRLASHLFQAKGPDDQPLYMDAALWGEPAAERTLLVSSGLHGVEGFFGSAVQLAWLTSQPTDWSPPPGTAVVLVHALNPFGFAWRRRWNENNVDLNRNFPVAAVPLAENPEYQECREAYARLHGFLNPPSAPSRWEPYTLKAILRILAAGYAARRRLPGNKRPSLLSLPRILDLGQRELQKALPVGQFEYARGLFYGGTVAEETTRILREKIPAWIGTAALTLHLDLHTGLGACGDYRLLLIDKEGSDRERWVSANFGETVVEGWDSQRGRGGRPTAYKARGTMAEYFRDHFSDRVYHGLTAEFGTYPGLRVLGAVRAENRAHFYGRPGSRSYRWAKEQLMEAFCPAAVAWRQTVVAKGLGLVEQALEVVVRPTPLR